ncbi:MAG: bifunctional phosphopantothenoylcysteine decarboxylase/phosphopantothenate--cysteine ligase CoaBC [Desulfobacterales bacterium]|nr:bifunctional phosphopantothenoylcysteine decarboxylase/phosphopantothenate--cysteine ligase CoaBC [Desulfobacterales bacterium]
MRLNLEFPSKLTNKNIVLGVCGGIAAYKSVELLRLLVKADANVRTIMTENAQWFVGPITFEALSGRSVLTSLFEKGEEATIKHIDWANEADAVVVAPATANIIGKLANGIADDPLSTFMTAVTAPVIICPSMNTHMYESQPVQRNLGILKGDGKFVITPDSGTLACGTIGPGRLPDPEDIVDRICSYLAPKDFTGCKVLVTAGPTQEPIDPVRYISNPSSGKMGFTVARAAEYRGASVTLISGPCHLADPNNVQVLRVESAHEMAEAVFNCAADFDIIIKTAAVCDYRPSTQKAQKIKKQKDTLNLKLEKTQDILLELGQRKNKQILVGFAAETQELESYAQGKLSEKNLDMIVGNIVGSEGSGFGANTNQVTIYCKDGSNKALPMLKKDEVADKLLDVILKMSNRL